MCKLPVAELLEIEVAMLKLLEENVSGFDDIFGGGSCCWWNHIM
jgi:hypothetical protein